MSFKSGEKTSHRYKSPGNHKDNKKNLYHTYFNVVVVVVKSDYTFVFRITHKAV